MRSSMVLLTIIFCGVFCLSSSVEYSTETKIVKGVYLGYVVDEDLEEEYYSFDIDNEFLDFYQVDEEVLEMYDLRSSDFEGSEFSIEYSQDEETAEMTLLKLRLVSK